MQMLVHTQQPQLALHQNRNSLFRHPRPCQVHPHWEGQCDDVAPPRACARRPAARMQLVLNAPCNTHSPLCRPGHGAGAGHMIPHTRTFLIPQLLRLQPTRPSTPSLRLPAALMASAGQHGDMPRRAARRLPVPAHALPPTAATGDSCAAKVRGATDAHGPSQSGRSAMCG